MSSKPVNKTKHALIAKRLMEKYTEEKDFVCFLIPASCINPPEKFTAPLVFVNWNAAIAVQTQEALTSELRLEQPLYIGIVRRGRQLEQVKLDVY